MNDDLIQARSLLASGEYTCVLCKGIALRTCTARGVRPLMDLLTEGGFSGYSAADKVVGKATAFLYILLGVSAIYAPVASEAAVRILESHQIEIHCDQIVPVIFNRSRSGLCPMESALRGIDDPHSALAAIQSTLSQMLHRQT